MRTIKNIGIYMDHAAAHLMELKNDKITSQSITSEFTYQEKERTIRKSENVMHNKEQHQQAKYYSSIKDVTKNYESILLFGPTNAKNELLNLMKEDRHFENIKIETVDADKMTENQQHVFIKKHFQPQL